MKRLLERCASIFAVCAAMGGSAAGWDRAQAPATSNGPAAPVAPADVPAGYVIGPEDMLSIVFWGEKDMSGDVIVRPDGKVSLPLINDIQAAGYTPEQLTQIVVKAASKYVAQPNATVIVKAINSRKVFIVGQVSKPGAFPLIGDLTVLQLLAQAGDVLEYAKSKDIVIVRKEEGGERRFKFNYKDVLRGRKTEQNILLKPGDTVIVP